MIAKNLMYCTVGRGMNGSSIRRMQIERWMRLFLATHSRIIDPFLRKRTRYICLSQGGAKGQCNFGEGKPDQCCLLLEFRADGAAQTFEMLS